MGFDIGGLIGTVTSASYDRATVRTNFSPPISISLAPSTGEPSAGLGGLVQPTIVLSGAAGERVIAPNGEASSWSGYAVTGAALVILLGGAFLLGRATA